MATQPSMATRGRAPSPARTRLLVEHDVVQAGKPFWVAVVLEMQPDWHCYWVNPGHAGFAPRLNWTVPETCRVGETAWPQPSRFMAFGQIGFGYETELAWLVQITPPNNSRPDGPLNIEVEVEWLLCRDACFRGKARHQAEVSLTLEFSDILSPHAENFQRYRSWLPQEPIDSTPAVFYPEGDGWVLQLPIPSEGMVQPGSGFFFPYESGWIDSVADQSTEVLEKTVFVRMRLCDPSRPAPKVLAGVLVWREGQAGSQKVSARLVSSMVD